MKKRFIFLIIIILLCLFVENPIFANEKEDFLRDTIEESTDIDDINKKTEDISGMSFEDIVKKVLEGDIDFSLSDAFNFFLNSLFGEIKDVFSIFIGMTAVMIMSALLRTVTTSFCGKSVGELGFYVCYMIMVLSICNVFYTGAEIAIETVENMGGFLNLTIPIFITLAVSSGGVGEGVVIAPFVGGVSTFIIGFISKFVVPLAVTVSTFEIINYISERDLLKSFTQLLKKCISMTLKGTALLFTGILSIQKLAVPAVSGVAGKTAKAVVGAVPVIGDVMSGTVESAVAMISAIKGSVSAVSIVIIIGMCLIPIIKLSAVFIMYRLAGALSEPFCDKRLIGCMECAGDFTLLIVGAVVTSAIIFIFSIIVIVTSGIL